MRSDLKTHSYKFINVGFDFNDSGIRINTFPAVLKRGHTYRLTVRLTTTLFVILPSSTPSTSDYMGVFSGGDNGRVELNSLFVKVGLDEREVLERLDSIENHRHIYLTGRGEGHNNTEAASSPPITSKSSVRTKGDDEDSDLEPESAEKPGPR